MAAVAPVDYAALCTKLEEQEIESPGGVAVPSVYTRLLAIYLLQNDLMNAKFLWKRIPQPIKSANAELCQVWTVGQKMWQRELPVIYESLNKEWSESLQPIMTAILESNRTRWLNLVGQAYSSINADDLAVFLGLPVPEALEVATSHGWEVDSASKMVHPKTAELKATTVIPSEKQLSRLTDFVSFLEN